MTHSRHYPNDPASVTAARQFAVDALAGHGADVVGIVELLVSELASNCVRHADSDFDLTITLAGDAVHVAATDRGDGTPVKRAADPLAESGRGLAIIDMMAGAWGVEPADPPQTGKTVWFTMPAPASAARAAGAACGAG